MGVNDEDMGKDKVKAKNIKMGLKTRKIRLATVITGIIPVFFMFNFSIAAEIGLRANTYFMDNENYSSRRQSDTLTIEKIFNDKAYKLKTPKDIQNRLQKAYYYFVDNNNLIRVSIDDKNVEQSRDTILNWTKEIEKWGLPKDESVFDFIWNKENNRVILLSEKESIYRRSFSSNAYMFEFDTAVSNSNTPQIKDVYTISQYGKVQEISFSPQGSGLAYLRNNNIYRIDLSKAIKEIAVTQDGELNKIINGHTDWVYEEEFGFSKAYQWSADGNNIAYLRFDESELKDFSFIQWGELYPTEYKYKYPKAGEKNSKVSLWVYNLSKEQKTLICRTEEQKDSSTNNGIEYIPNIEWLPKSSTLLFYTLNRHQNDFKIWKWTALAQDNSNSIEQNKDISLNASVKCLYNETNPCYVDIDNAVYSFEDESHWILASEKEGYRHLYLYDFDGKLIRKLTNGKYDVRKLYGVDTERKIVYFQANYTAPYNSDLMCVGLNGKNLRRLAIDLQLKGGTANAYFSSDFRKAVITYSDAKTPTQYCEYILNGRGEQLVAVIEGNEKLRARMQMDGVPQRTFGVMNVKAYRQNITDSLYKAGNDKTVDLLKSLDKKASSFDSLYYWVMKPEKMEEGKKYPVLMFLYGGPGSQQVLNQYGGTDYWWYSYLVQHGYIIVCIDNRGTAGRGADFKKCTYLQLGRYETEDQIAGARFIANEWDFVDSNRIGIWGWSYGGFMSSNCLLRGNGLWKMAIAVAPVTNWRYYDNVYTERFMRTPKENPMGYDANSPISKAKDLQGAYLLVHGSSDDNVHLQNSIDMVTALQKNMKQFDFQIYPNKNHSIIGGNTREQLYNLFTRFIKTNL